MHSSFVNIIGEQIWELQTIFSGKTTQFMLLQIRHWWFLQSRVTLKFDGWPSKTIGHLFFTTSSFVQHFIAIGEFKLKLQSGNTQFGSKSAIYCPVVMLLPKVWLNLSKSAIYDLEIWWMTLENNRAPLLYCFKLCASFHSHQWIQTGVTVRKRPIWVKIEISKAVRPWNLTDDLGKQ